MRMQITPTPFFIHLEAYPFACTPHCRFFFGYIKCKLDKIKKSLENQKNKFQMILIPSYDQNVTLN